MMHDADIALQDLNTLVQQEKLKKGSFVRIKQFQTNEVKGKK